MFSSSLQIDSILNASGFSVGFQAIMKLPELHLPVDKPRLKKASSEMLFYEFSLKKQLSKKLSRLAERKNKETHQIILAAYQLFLSRYSRQKEFAIGVDYSDRKPGAMLPLHTKVSNKQSFQGFFLASQRAFLAAKSSNLVVPVAFPDLLSDFDAPSRHPLFKAVFRHYNKGGPEQVKQLISWDQYFPCFDFALEFMEDGDSFILKMSGAKDLFYEESLERMGQNFCQLLDECISNPGKEVSLLQIIGGKEKVKLLKNWNKPVSHHIEKNFLELFQEQVQNYPQNIALVVNDKKITYKELSDRSNAIAGLLQNDGCKTGDVIGLCVRNNEDFIAGMLGILKSGAVYLPLDMNYPSKNLQFMLNDAKPTVILTTKECKDLLRGYKTLCFEKAQHSSSYLRIYKEPILKPQDLAYIVYTSGTTGNSKGIKVAHQSLPNISISHKPYYPKNARALISGGICFDASILMIFHVLINNGTLYLLDYEFNRDLNELIDYILQKEINTLICVPSLYVKILSQSNSFPKLKSVSLTGENLPRSLCELHARYAPNAVLYNEYGPTECAIGTSIAKIYDPKEKKIQTVTVGKPLKNTRVYILDENLNLVPIGCKGEICIAGIGLAEGYLNNEKLTRDKFPLVPLSRERIRLYRTGDFGRYLPDGQIEYLGRVEHRIQADGQSIDLGEIEHAISQLPEVKEAVVIAKADHSNVPLLTAYFTSSAKGSIANLVRDVLRSKLPRQLIPSSFVQLNQFNLSPNGKIERTCLT